jgi:hypothetical protein
LTLPFSIGAVCAAPIHPLYRPHGTNGEISLFDGELDLKTPDGKWSTQVQVELELLPETRLMARVFGSARLPAFFNEPDDLELEAPDGTSLAPPGADNPRSKSESHQEFRLRQVRLGKLQAAESFLFHVCGALEVWADPVPVDSGSQKQLKFDLPGWELVMVPGEPTPDSRDFAAVILATPVSSAVSEEDLDRLHRWLFILLSFVADREVGIGPVCGLDKAGAVVWVEWGTPRMKPGEGGIKWCPPMLAAVAIPQLAKGFSVLAEDPDLEVIVDRAIGYALAANGEEVIEVRIPNVCSGLELLAWAILQREDWLVDADVRRRMKTAAIIRLFLKWAEIPTAVPPTLPDLTKRLAAVGKAGLEGPEVLFELRNSMVHPPKRLDNIEWPEGEELVDAWLLGSWYLELGLLRVLGYDGKYWSRIRLGRPGVDVESVPWTI